MERARIVTILGLVLTLAIVSPMPAAFPSHADLIYSETNGIQLKLDLYLPETGETKSKPGLVMWGHGGAWRSGSKANPPVTFLTQEGFAIASIDYRLSTQVHSQYKLHKLDAHLEVVHGGEHGGTPFYSEANRKLVTQFLQKHLR